MDNIATLNEECNGRLMIAPEPGSHFLGTIEMSVDDWFLVRDNPRQRDTERHLRNAGRRHLAKPHPTHARVAMAQLPDGARYKLDGHTRALAWSTGRLMPPAKLTVDVYACETLAQVAELYMTFDNQAATETGVDKVTGAIREAGIAPNSTMVKSGKIGSAVKIAHAVLFRTVSGGRPDGIYQAVVDLKPEIIAIDGLEPKPRDFPWVVMAAAFITLRVEGQRALEFWRRYAADDCVKDRDGCDAVYALRSRLTYWREKKQLGSRGFEREHIRLCIQAYKGFRSNTTYQKSGQSMRPIGEDAFRAFIDRASQTGRGR